MTSQEVSKALNVRPQQLWQLSKNALSGMAAGLLSQPKKKLDPKDDPKILRKKIQELQAAVATQQKLIQIIRELPGVKYKKAVRGKHASRKTTAIPPGSLNEGRQILEPESGGEVRVTPSACDKLGS